MAKVVIFGVVDTAQLAKYYLENDSEHEVIAFTVTKDYIESEQFEGLSVVAFEELFDAHTNWEEGDEPIEGQNLAFEYQDVVEGGAALITDNAAEDRQRTAPVLED